MDLPTMETSLCLTRGGGGWCSGLGHNEGRFPLLGQIRLVLVLGAELACKVGGEGGVSVVSVQTVSLGFSIGLAGGLMGTQTSFSRSGRRGGPGVLHF